MIIGTQMSDIHDVNIWLGRSNWTADENLQGEFDEFRVYDRVLALPEIQFNDAIGPDNALGQPMAVRIAAPNSLQVGQTIVPTVSGDFASISNVDLTIARCFVLDSSDTSVLTADASGQLHAVGEGTANAIVHLSGLSSSVPISVTSGAPPADNHVAISKSNAGGYNLTFKGTPGTTYRIQRTTDLTAPITWTDISTQTAPPSGIIFYNDATPPAGQAFYQVVTP
jgi:hypothetical protein